MPPLADSNLFPMINFLFKHYHLKNANFITEVKVRKFLGYTKKFLYFRLWLWTSIPIMKLDAYTYAMHLVCLKEFYMCLPSAEKSHAIKGTWIKICINISVFILYQSWSFHFIIVLVFTKQSHLVINYFRWHTVYYLMSIT